MDEDFNLDLEKFKLEKEKVTLDREKFALEQEKVKIERGKTKWTVISVVAALLAVGANIRATGVQAQAQLELQAAQFAMGSKSAAEFEGKRRTLAALFPNRFGSQFKDFNPESFENYGPGDEEARKELFKVLAPTFKTRREIVALYDDLFPGPDEELYGKREWVEELIKKQK